MQISVRLSDRVVIQVGQSLGLREGCEVIDLTTEQGDALNALLAQPHGDIYMSTAGALTADPYVAPPPVVLADQTSFDAAVNKLRNTFGTSRSIGDVNLCLDGMTVILRRLYRELQ